MIHVGDCLLVMPTLDADSIDAIVTDPPYGLGFMGKDWDHGVPGEHFWREALRVAKPGALLVAFGGTRTFHRLACAIEDAGWEIRDTLMWLYGSGFPKSLDVAKAIDKRGGNAHLAAEIGAAIKAARERRGITSSEADARYCGSSTLWSWYEGRPAGQQMPTAAVMKSIAEDWPELRAYADAIAEAEREVIGHAAGSRLAVAPGEGRDRSDKALAITAPSTRAAQEWQGWGTALKPAWEPIILARKPLQGTVAANVLRHGTGAMNVDGCRVSAGGGRPAIESRSEGALNAFGNGLNGSRAAGTTTQGRWPANVVHDGSDEVVALFPGDAGAYAPVRGTEASSATANAYGDRERVPGAFHADKGSAARFFYTAKAGREDRNWGCDEFAERPLHWSSGLQNPGSFQAEGTKREAKNNHPTVKPHDLMRWLCRLVTPPGGLVLDPFCGSGSTGRAAIAEGFRFVGIELDPQYAAIAQARMHATQPGFSFGGGS